MFKVPEEYRLKDVGGPLSSSEEDGNNGAFLTSFESRDLFIIASDGKGWEHVSVSIKTRTPNWKEMCYIKDMFWGPEDCVVQYHPPENEYVNNHPYTLHLWRKPGIEFPAPDSILVGIK